jgi:microcystin degradation protein MlrC
MSARKFRIAVAGFMHESNTFNPLYTDRAAFEAQSLTFGPALLDEWAPAHHEMGGFIEAVREQGDELVPLVMAWATPAGPVRDRIFDEITGRLAERLRQEKPDGLLLALHGAMVTESHLDADGETLARLRQAVGPNLPIVVTLDFHGNVSQRLIDNCQAAVSYQTNPHVDQRACGRKAATLLNKILRDGLRPAQALSKPPLIVNIMVQDTSCEPLRSFLAQARELEREPECLSVSLMAGFPYADVPQMGPSVIVVSAGDQARAQRTADSFGERLWEARQQMSRKLPDAVTAVRQALQADRVPVVLVDTGDNVGGGSAGDGTVILAEILRQRATDSVVCLYAPNEVQECLRSGVGRQVTLTVGGKVDRHHGEPVAIQGQVKLLHDGVYVEPEIRHGGKRVNHMGLTAMLELADGNLLVLNSQRHPPFSLGQLTCLGIRPERMWLLVVKAAIAYKAAYAPVGGTIIEVDTPGLTAVNPERFAYRHIRRPLYPLD